jgi:ABC-type multidrug transport system ATPase subunit
MYSSAATADVDVEMTDLKGSKTEKVKLQVPITFCGLTYSVETKDGTKVILNSLDGCFVPGRMCALFGPSGCGKTSLMDVLSGRKNSGTITGAVRFDGAACDQRDLKHICGYVEQFDNLVEDLTVEQMLRYTAELKLPALSAADRENRVEEVIQLMQLQGCRSTIIGGALATGVSGGQKKRVNIGLALITRPPILFLDEPTTGLDSAMANEVVGIMSFLASQGRTVVSTIHSPTASAFSLFDDLVMLRKGRLVYGGPCGEAASTYFVKEVGLRPLELGESMPEWLVDSTSSNEVNEAMLSERARALHQKRVAGRTQPLTAASLAETFRASAAFERSSAARKKLHGDGSKPRVAVPAHLRRAGPLRCIYTLLKYRTLCDYKSPVYLGPRIGDKFIFAFIVLTLYAGEGEETSPQKVQGLTGVLFMVVALCGYGAASVVATLVLDRPLFYRETNDGCYGPCAYYIYKLIQEGFLCVFTSLMFMLMVYWGVGFQGNFAMMGLIYYLTTMISVALAYAIASLAPDVDTASAMLPTYVTTVMFVGGLIMLIEEIPDWWAWYGWTSFIRYAWAALMLTQFDGTASGEAPLFLDSSGNGITVLDFYGIEGSVLGSTTACVGMLVLIFAFFVSCGMAVISNVRHERR